MTIGARTGMEDERSLTENPDLQQEWVLNGKHKVDY